MSLVELLDKYDILDNLYFNICSVGARDIGYEDLDNEWFRLGNKLAIYGFEPDDDECEKLSRTFKGKGYEHSEVYISKALSDKISEKELFITAWEACSSLYRPNEIFCSRFAGLSEPTKLVKSIKIDCTTLDYEFQSTSLDFLKIDVQGSELDVLVGGESHILPNLLVAQVEVEFSPLYSRQPLFADIDTYMRNQGFSLLSLDPIYKLRSISPIAGTPRFGSSAGQILWGEAIYYRDLINYENGDILKTADNLIKLTCILSCLSVSRYIDICVDNLVYLAANYGHTKYNNYFAVEQLLCELYEKSGILSEPIEKALEELPSIQTVRFARELAAQIQRYD